MYQVVRFLALVPLVFFAVFYGGLLVTVGPILALLVLLFAAGAVFSDENLNSQSSGNEAMPCSEFSPGWCDWAKVPGDQVIAPSDLFTLSWARAEEMLGMPIWLFLVCQLVIVALCWLAYREAVRRQRVRVGALAIERLYAAPESYAASLKGAGA